MINFSWCSFVRNVDMSGRLIKTLRGAASDCPILGTRSVLTHTQQVKDEKIDICETEEWASAKPFETIPGPSKFELLKAFMPGGRYYKKPLPEINRIYRKDYGEIFMLPGLFGKRNVVCSFDPEDYQKVFRTEGIWPVRRGLDIVHYYRKILRPHIFKHAAGLVAEQGENWAHFRKITNPVMMNPKTTKFYVPRMDNAMKEFIERIKSIRDPKTFEVPVDFENDLNHWAMESACLVALDTELGLINHAERNPEAKEVIDGSKYTFELMYELDFEPSLWKIIPTPKYKRIVENFDKVTELTIKYIDAAIERLKNAPNPGKPDSEKSVLERLLNIDREVAIVMAMDILLAGVDTTSSALTGCLITLSQNPNKQDILRSEILKILPNKDTSLNADKMKNLPYLRACIKEAFRLFPVSVGQFRSTGRDLVLNGYRIPKDTDIAMPSQILMRDEKFYPRPNDFIPERWLRDVDKAECPMAKNVNAFVFLPFGFGPRTCIGRRISDLELETALCRLIRNFHIQFDYPEDISFKTTILNSPDFALRFNFKDVEV
ncbi:cytochrome P450 CYP12A2-like [Episyrphus balteatus]|uniref:cytochrome P450 CYP12A2-like n=1 Tax=Episyrphus balteatus TaxID=286459 RepID=UPI002484FD4B|nr:cytochrome P450 CYP12A2-like [Episyrphus balteatus]